MATVYEMKIYAENSEKNHSEIGKYNNGSHVLYL